MYNQVILLGIVVSILYNELTDLPSGGLIVPGYIVLNFRSPPRIIYTLVIAILAVLCCRGISRITILYGRRRFVAMILLSFALNTLAQRTGILLYSAGMIGYLVPGIIAQECDRQGFFKSFLGVAIVSSILLLVVIIAGIPIGGII